MKLESGPAKADRNWQILRAALFLGFAAWFLHDGLRGYPHKNRAEAEKILETKPFEGKVKFDDLADKPTRATFEALKESKPTTNRAVRDALGEPTFVDGSDEYYMSRYGRGKVVVRSGAVRWSESTWQPWKKTREEIKAQFFWAIIPAIPGLYFLWRLYKAATLRVVIDDEGMVYDNRRIAFERMKSLRDYSPKGWIDLYYEDDGNEKKLRLDNEKVLLFDDIVAAICEVKGFTNEVKDYAEQKARGDSADDADDSEAVPAAGPDDAESNGSNQKE